MSPQTGAKKLAEQAQVTALVGEIGADTAPTGRRMAVIPTRIRFPQQAHRRVGTRGNFGDRPPPRRLRDRA